MKLKKALILCSILAAAAAIQTGASAATQVGEAYNYTGTENSASASDNSKISPYLDEKWTIPTTETRGIMTGQSTRLGTYTDADKQMGENFGKCFTGAKNNYRFASGLDSNIIYYTFDYMGSGDTGSININGQRLNGANNTVSGVTYKGIPVTSFADGEHKNYRPFKVTVIADKLNNKAYYCAVKSQTGDKLDATIDMGQEAEYLDIGNGYGTTNQRYFFKNFSYGTIDYAVNGADSVTAGSSSDYTIAETGASLGVDYTPANMTLALASSVDGVNLENGTLTVENTVANNTEVTINANINGTTVASKTVTIANPPAAEPTVSTEKLSSTTGDDGSVADVYYATFNANGSSANTVNVTVNNVKKSITTANMSGDAKVYFGIVISYADGNNKGYTPTFTFE